MRRSQQTIEFLCREEDRGVIAEPLPARNELPEWFRQLPGTDRDHLSATNDGLTVKRCTPFRDALTTGWIIPLAATIRLEVRDEGKHVEAGWQFDRTMVSNHSAFQIAGNPYEPRPPMKIHNYWTVRTAPGWSSLFVPALNRPNGIVELFSGVVDTDTFATPVNFPFVVTAADGVHVLPKGTPLAQVIPFRRDEAAIKGTVRSETKREQAERTRTHRSIMSSGSWYRRHARAKR
jgi:Family of unknown function (DUF6065)